MITVKEAVRAVTSFISDMYGSSSSNYTVLEEVEYEPEFDVWLITMSIQLPSSFINDQEPRIKVFRVSGDTGEVMSMKYPPAQDVSF